MNRIVFALSLLVFATDSGAVELRHTEVRTGTEGLQPVPLSVANAAGAPVVCVGELAHWYSAELAHAGTGATARIDLWFDPQSGTYSVLNQKSENMPVEALWCGLAGQAYATRSVVTLNRQAGAEPPPLALTCTKEATRLVCE